MKKRRNPVDTAFGYILFSGVITVAVMSAVLIYDKVNREFGGNRKVISVTMIVVIIGLAGICTLIDYLRRKFTVDKTVDKILEATDRIASGNFNVHLSAKHSVKHYNEYDYITDNISRMAAELGKNEVLKNDFISNVSHEIKTPLAVIRNYAEALRDESLAPQTRKNYAEVLMGASAKLTDLVMNILKLNKLENQELKPETAKVRLGEMLAEAVLGFEDAIEKKNLQLDCDIDEVTVITSPSYLEIVWNNLLSNAIKFTPDGGKISVALKIKDGRAAVKITDTGCGISEETGKHIFDKFYQGDNSHAKEGNGLGLALVKKVIDILGGEISVESELNRGSVFTVTLGELVLE